MFVHDKWVGESVKYVSVRAQRSIFEANGIHSQAGWWGHDPVTRFDMPPKFSAIPGAQGFQQSNPSVLAVIALLGALEVFRDAGGMAPLRARSLRLTGYLEELLQKSKYWIPPDRAGQLDTDSDESKKAFGLTIITPTDPAARGSQLSLAFIPLGGKLMPKVLECLEARGVIGDSRKPDVIRLAPCALYNSFEDVERAAAVLEEAMGIVERGIASS